VGELTRQLEAWKRYAQWARPTNGGLLDRDVDFHAHCLVIAYRAVKLVLPWLQSDSDLAILAGREIGGLLLDALALDLKGMRGLPAVGRDDV
jgi:hypothetical protein